MKSLKVRKNTSIKVNSNTIRMIKQIQKWYNDEHDMQVTKTNIMEVAMTRHYGFLKESMGKTDDIGDRIK